MKRILAIPVLCMAVALAVSTQAKDVLTTFNRL